jgi:hypothetical protein
LSQGNDCQGNEKTKTLKLFQKATCGDGTETVAKKDSIPELVKVQASWLAVRW